MRLAEKLDWKGLNTNVNDIEPRFQPPPKGKILGVPMLRYEAYGGEVG
jgi:hypothetical protein